MMTLPEQLSRSNRSIELPTGKALISTGSALWPEPTLGPGTMYSNWSGSMIKNKQSSLEPELALGPEPVSALWHRAEWNTLANTQSDPTYIISSDTHALRREETHRSFFGFYLKIIHGKAHERIANSNSFENIADILIEYSYQSIAKQLTDLCSLVALEEDEKPLSLGSAQHLTLFLFDIAYFLFPPPTLAASDDGLLQAEWHLKRDRHLNMKFFENGLIRATAISPNAQNPGVDRVLSVVDFRKPLLVTLRNERILDWLRMSDQPLLVEK